MESPLRFAKNAKIRITDEELAAIANTDIKTVEQRREQRRANTERILNTVYTYEDYYSYFIRNGFDEENATILATKNYNRMKQLAEKQKNLQ